MSSNRLLYDYSEYNQRLGGNTNQLSYTLNPLQYVNPNQCRFELGVVGGNNVSQVKGNLVDLESDLMGVTRKNPYCISNKYKNACATQNLHECGRENIVIDGPGCTMPRAIDTTPIHLPSCNMFRYKPVPLPPPMDLPKYPGIQKNRCE